MTRGNVSPKWFALDAVVTGANALAYVLAAGLVAEVTGLAPDPGRKIGIGLLVVAIVAWRSGPRWLAWDVVAINAAWVIASVVVAATNILDRSTVGRV